MAIIDWITQELPLSYKRLRSIFTMLLSGKSRVEFIIVVKKWPKRNQQSTSSIAKLV